MSNAGAYPIGALLVHLQTWSIRMEHWLRLNLEQESLEERETVNVAGYVYFIVTLSLMYF